MNSAILTMDVEESLERARSEIEMIHAAYPDEITVHQAAGGCNSFPFRFTLHLSSYARQQPSSSSSSSNDASITMELIEGYPEDTPVQITNFSCDNTKDKSRIDLVVKAVRNVAQQCQEDGMEGALSACSTALQVWRDAIDDDCGNDETDSVVDTSPPSTLDNSEVNGGCTGFSSSAPSTYKWVSGEPLTDRKSVFQAHLCRIESPSDVDKALVQLLQSSSKMQRATHHMHAWRLVTDSSDGGSSNHHRIVQHDNDDDGEDGAGSKLSYLLDMRQDNNCLVVVSRWYGGTHLGPKRFAHIVNVARELLVAQHNSNQQDSCCIASPQVHNSTNGTTNRNRKR